MYYTMYRLPPGEQMLDELYFGQDELNRRVIARVETCNGAPAKYQRMLSFKDGDEQVVRECSYGFTEKAARANHYIRLIILRGTGIEHTARGDWKHRDYSQVFRTEDFEPFTSVKDALAYGRSWVRSNVKLDIEVAEAAV